MSANLTKPYFYWILMRKRGKKHLNSQRKEGQVLHWKFYGFFIELLLISFGSKWFFERFYGNKCFCLNHRQMFFIEYLFEGKWDFQIRKWGCCQNYKFYESHISHIMSVFENSITMRLIIVFVQRKMILFLPKIESIMLFILKVRYHF
jgi:hypothetical protein